MMTPPFNIRASPTLTAKVSERDSWVPLTGSSVDMMLCVLCVLLLFCEISFEVEVQVPEKKAGC